MPAGHQTMMAVRRLLSEAAGICTRAREASLDGHGQVTGAAKIVLAFQYALRKDILIWLQHAEEAAKSATGRGGIATSPTCLELLKQSRLLIDSANVALSRRS